MSEAKTDLLRGTLDLLILRALSLQPEHGVGITRRICQLTKGTFDVKSSPARCFPRCIGWKRGAGSPRSGASPRVASAPSSIS